MSNRKTIGRATWVELVDLVRDHKEELENMKLGEFAEAVYKLSTEIYDRPLSVAQAKDLCENANINYIPTKLIDVRDPRVDALTEGLEKVHDILRIQQDEIERLKAKVL